VHSEPNPQNSLKKQIKQLLGFTPTRQRGLGRDGKQFLEPGWLYRGGAKAICPGCESPSQKHVWEQPEIISWTVVCTQCGVAWELMDFPDIEHRESLSEAQIGDIEIEPQPVFQVGFFCCGPCPEAVALINLLSAERNQRNSTHRNLKDNYPLVLDVFKAIHPDASSSQEQLQNKLRELQPHLKQLREDYNRDYRSMTVTIEYSGRTADAYLLAYVPGCINQAEKALRQALEIMPNGTQSTLQSQRMRIEFHLFDLNTVGWSQTRQGLLDLGCIQRWSGDLDIYPHQFDLRDSEGLSVHRETLQTLDLAIFQNCNNEIGERNSAERDAANRTITKIAAQLKPNAQLILSDLQGSEVNQEQLRGHWMTLGIGEIEMSRTEPHEVTRIHPPCRNPLLNQYFFSDDKDEWRIARVKLPSLNILVLNRADLTMSERRP